MTYEQSPLLNLSDPPRRVRISPMATRLRVSFWIFSLATTVLMGWLCAQSVKTEKQLEYHGVRVASKVVDKFYYNAGGRGSIKYRLKVRFREGKLWMIEPIHVSSDEYDQYEIGSPVVVTYLPQDESTIRLGPVTAATVTRAAVSNLEIVGISFAILLLLPLLIEYMIGRQATLLRLGRTATATIERIEAESRGGRTVRYAFDAEGAQWKGSGVYVKTWSIDPSPGLKIPILYLPGRPKRNSPVESITAVSLRGGSVFDRS